MAEAANWSLQQRREQTNHSEFKHAMLLLSKLRKWNAKLVTAEASESLSEMDGRINNIEIALQRTADSNQLNQPQLARDLTVELFDYYDKRGRWDDWIRLGPLGLEACQRLSDTYSLGEAYPIICNSIGIAQRMLNSLDKAMSLFKRALESAIKDELRSDAFTNMADVHRLRGEFEQALQCAQHAIELGQKANDKVREAKGLEYMGLTYTSLREYEKAIECHERALHLREETGNLPRVALVLNFLSAALTYRGGNDDVKRAFEGYQRVYEIEIQLKNQLRIADCYGALGRLHSNLGQYAKSIDYLQMALGFQEEIAFFRGVAGTHILLAYAYLQSDELERMIFHIEQACKYRQYLLAPDRILNAREFCQTLLKAAEFVQQENVESAKEFIKIAKSYAEEANLQSLQTQAVELQQRLT